MGRPRIVAAHAQSSYSAFSRWGPALTRTGTPRTSTSTISLVERRPGDVVFPVAERARLLHQDFGQGGYLRRLGQERDDVAGAALLGHDRDQPGIERAGAHQRFDGVAQHLACHVVDVGFDHDQFLEPARSSTGTGLKVAHHHLEHIGTPSNSRVPAP